MTTIFKKIILFSVPFLLGMGHCYPAEGAKNVKIEPHFDVTGWYDDNIEFSAQSEESDFYAVISPGIAVDILTRFFDIKADYSYIRYQYRDHSDLNRDYHRAKVEVGKEPGFEVFRNVTLKFGDKYELVPIDIRRPEEEPENLTERNRFYFNSTWIKRFSSRNTLQAGYEFSRVDYTKSGRIGRDYWCHRFSATWEGKVVQRLTFMQNNSYIIYDYDDIPTYTQFIPDLGAKLSLYKNLTLSGRAGYSFEETRDYHHRGEVYNLAATYEPSEKFQTKASFRRKRTTDVEGNLFTLDYYELLCRYRPVRRLSFHGNIRYYQYKDIDIKRLRYKFGLDYQLRKGLKLGVGYVRLQTVDTPPEESAQSNRFYGSVSIVF